MHQTTTTNTAPTIAALHALVSALFEGMDAQARADAAVRAKVA